jgi:hypothetical protein
MMHSQSTDHQARNIRDSQAEEQLLYHLAYLKKEAEIIASYMYKKHRDSTAKANKSLTC